MAEPGWRDAWLADSGVCRLPEIQKELGNAIRETEQRLHALPKAPSSDPVGEVLHVLSNFTRDLSRRLDGTPEEDGLLQTIRPHQQAFKLAIRATAPLFVPWERKKPQQDLPAAEFLANEEDDQEGKPKEEDDQGDIYSRPFALPGILSSALEAASSSEKIYIDEVLKRAHK